MVACGERSGEERRVLPPLALPRPPTDLLNRIGRTGPPQLHLGFAVSRDDLDPYPLDQVGPMRFLDRTLPRVEENLALDEAILQEVEDDGRQPILRLWESPVFAVILG